MPGTGLIVAFIVVLWAAYWVPLALRRYDEASKAGTVDKLSSLSRIIPHRAHRDDADEPTVTTTAAVQEHAPAPVSAPAAAPSALDRPAARLAAKRRRRTLLTLVGLAVVVALTAVVGVVPVWSPALPIVLIVAWLVACRVQVRAERGISRPRVERPASARPAKRGRDTASADVGEATVVVSHQFEDIDPDRQHVMVQAALEADALDDKITIAVPVGTTKGQAVWDPLPVTLPTYVTKPRAGRTVRTIEFGEPGAWTSGHVEGEDVELPQKSASSDDTRRAAGQ